MEKLFVEQKSLLQKLFCIPIQKVVHSCRNFRKICLILQPQSNMTMTKILWTILLLVCSNIFMTFAWYGHLKLQEMKISTGWPLILVILFSWGVAFFEYCAQVPANRIGFEGNGGPFSLMQLKVIQEVISLTVFTVLVTVFFKGEALQWNHFAAFLCLILAVFFVFMK